jgi:hypothetical protein
MTLFVIIVVVSLEDLDEAQRDSRINKEKVMKSLALWKGIFANPIEGFKQITPETKVGLPILLILLMALIAGLILIPIATDPAYSDTQYRLVMKMQGDRMGETQKAELQKYYASDTNKIVSVFQYPLGFLINGVIGLFLSALVLFIIGKIFKAEIDFGKALRITVFAAAVVWIGMIIKGGIAVLSDWKSALSSAESMLDINGVIMAPVSLAAFFSSAAIGRIPYLILNIVTDVFTIGNTFFVAAGVTSVCNVKFSKALVVSVIGALLGIIVNVVILVVTPA